MYLQITTKCNMSCAHCCYRCSMHGMHMRREVWETAIDFAKNQEDSISIGGGEPTLHPNFWEILGLCLGSFEFVWLATNGSQTNTAIALAGLAKKGAIGCALSQDYWHDEIDYRVVEAFQIVGRRGDNDGREIRNVSEHPENLSPGRDPTLAGNPKNCPCPGLFITPTGKIKACGCRRSPVIGNVFDGISTPTPEDGWYDCHKVSMRKVQEVRA